MFYYLTVFVFILAIPHAILAIQCLDCFSDLNLMSPEEINITGSDCIKKTFDGDTCVSSLLINFHKKNGSATFTQLPNQVLTFSNGIKTTIISTTIWFTKTFITQSIQSMNTDSDALINDTNTIFNTSKSLKAEELRTKLLGHLYNDILSVANLTCLNNKNETIQCPNGFCQLNAFGTIVDRKCVPQSRIPNRLGIIIASTNIDESNSDTTIVYGCNKPMCNGAEMDQTVQNLLSEYGLVNTGQPTTTVSPDISVTTTSPPKNKGDSTMKNFQWTIISFLSNVFVMIFMGF